MRKPIGVFDDCAGVCGWGRPLRVKRGETLSVIELTDTDGDRVASS
jgi:hypothetical protein